VACAPSEALALAWRVKQRKSAPLAVGAISLALMERLGGRLVAPLEDVRWEFAPSEDAMETAPSEDGRELVLKRVAIATTALLVQHQPSPVVSFAHATK
jgi:hypothetical protein